MHESSIGLGHPYHRFTGRNKPRFTSSYLARAYASSPFDIGKATNVTKADVEKERKLAGTPVSDDKPDVDVSAVTGATVAANEAPETEESVGPQLNMNNIMAYLKDQNVLMMIGGVVVLIVGASMGKKKGIGPIVMIGGLVLGGFGAYRKFAAK